MILPDVTVSDDVQAQANGYSVLYIYTYLAAEAEKTALPVLTLDSILHLTK